MRKELSAKDYIEGIKSGDRTILARAISLVESTNEEHDQLAQEILGKLKTSERSKVVGISGTPGVGKSTFIEALGMKLIEKNLKIAVLAIDPSSVKTGGSILGDKTRMQNLSAHPNAFIRPSASGKTLGGVTAKTRESIFLCEVFGFDVILVETVGVGQSELTVGQMVDFFLLLMQPGSGDDLQGIKRGILEVCDLLAINKADGDQLNRANLAKSEFELALKILRSSDGQIPKVYTCSATEGTGIDQIWKEIELYFQNNDIESKRQKQLGYWLEGLLQEKLRNYLGHNPEYLRRKELALEKLWQRKSNIYKEVNHLISDLVRGNFESD